MNPVGQWVRIEGYDKSTGGFGYIDPGISLPLSFWGKSQTTLLLAEPKLPNPQSCSSHPTWTDVRLYPEKLLTSMITERVPNYSNETGPLKE